MVCDDCNRLLYPRHKTISAGQELFRRRRCLSRLIRSSTTCGICAALSKTCVPRSLRGYNTACDGSMEKCRDVIIFFAHLTKHKDELGTFILSIRVGRVDKAIRDTWSWTMSQGTSFSTEFLLVPTSKKGNLCDPVESRDIPISTGSSGALDTAKSWLERCKHDHSWCRQAEEAQSGLNDQYAFFPSRLIHILPDGLRLSTNHSRKSQYATLSHRWPSDGSTIASLTTTNIASWQNFIPADLSDFPQSFRDAMHVCQHLDIEYLWVDSLCIIQAGDRGADWQQEASRMGEVYKHATLNIAATACADGQDSLRNGFFRQREPALIRPCIIKSPCDLSLSNPRNSLIDSLVIAAHGTSSSSDVEYYVVPLEQMSEQVVDAPLNRRAWVMQERYLSPRILHFTKEKIWFECHEGICSETYSANDPVELYYSPPRSSYLSDQRQCTSQLFPVRLPVCLKRHPTDVYQLWYELVAVYSRAGLTKNNDKLVALSGVAREIRDRNRGLLPGNDYCAGLWYGDLPAGLLWHIPLPSLSGKDEASTLQAPSWSWASTNAAVKFNYALYQSPHQVLVTVMTVNVVPVMADSVFGQIQPGGTLTIKGNLSKARIHLEGGVSTTSCELQIVSKQGAVKIKSPLLRLWRDRPVQSVNIKVLPIFTSRESTPEHRNWKVMLMLIPTGKTKEYQRYGIVELDSEQDAHAAKEIAQVNDILNGGREEVITIV